MTANEENSEALPLGWTRVRRKRNAPSSVNGDVNEDQCCIDEESCLRLAHSKRPRSESKSTSSATERNDKMMMMMIEGQVIFCLQDTNPAWMQGYFFPKASSLSSSYNNGSKKPWGLLAIQEELDDCLACADGGFRRLTLKVYKPDEEKGSPPKEILNIDWTGGDMMRLSHDDVTMETDKLYAGPRALPYLNKCFASMVEKLRKECDVAAEMPILEWMPDVAVLVGTLSLSPSSLSPTKGATLPEESGTSGAQATIVVARVIGQRCYSKVEGPLLQDLRNHGKYYFWQTFGRLRLSVFSIFCFGAVQSSSSDYYGHSIASTKL